MKKSTEQLVEDFCNTYATYCLHIINTGTPVTKQVVRAFSGGFAGALLLLGYDEPQISDVIEKSYKKLKDNRILFTNEK